MKKTLNTAVLCALLTGCADTDFSSIGQSTFGLSSGTRGSGNSMPVLTKASPPATTSASQQFTLPVDIDTAAMRLKRHYGYLSSEEIERIRNKDRNSRWSAAAIDQAHPVWEALPGRFYRMGSDVGNADHMDIELEKVAAGTRVTVMYKSPVRLSASALDKVVERVRQVASGKGQ